MRTITQTRNSRFSLFTTTTLLALLCATAFAQQKGTFKDTRDGKTYKTVKMGTQTWMAENLNYNAEGSKCYGEGGEIFSFDKGKATYTKLSAAEIRANCTKYGKLYNWETAMLACPKGWHLPTKDELDTLINFAGGEEIAGKNLKAKSGWNKNSEGKSGNGTDKFGFAALPGSDDAGSEGFSGAGSIGSWWSATENGRNAYYLYMHGNDGAGYGGTNNDPWGDDRVTKFALRSVRCVQGEPSAEAKEIIADIEAEKEKWKKAVEAEKKAEAEAKVEEARIKRIEANRGTFTDTRDKKTYKTIKIGNQTWMAENLNYNANGSACYGDDPVNCYKYGGRIYNWETAMATCPSGWHLPTDAEWDILITATGGSSTAGGKLKAKSGWSSSGGTDEYGFAALPTGNCAYNANGFLICSRGDRAEGNWWSATENKDNTKSNYRQILHNAATASNLGAAKRYMFLVRCLKGEAGAAEKKIMAKIEAEEKAKPSANQPASQPQPSQKPASQPQPNQNPNENCSITFPKKACVVMPTGTCKMAGGKVVDKCP